MAMNTLIHNISIILLTPHNEDGMHCSPPWAETILAVTCKCLYLLLDSVQNYSAENLPGMQFSVMALWFSAINLFPFLWVEKAREHNVPIHFNFIDFKAAFDTVCREALWRML